MTKLANFDGTSDATIAGQDSGEPQLDKADTIRILKQQLVKITKDRNERLIKDVEGVLQSYTSKMESDLIYIINEYTTVKSKLDELNRENIHLKAVNATLSEQLIGAQHNRHGSGSSANDKAAIENLRLELDITTKELSRALEDVEKLKAQHSQMEVAIQHKDVVNHQLAVIVNNRQTDINLKQKENAGLTAQLIDTRAKLVQAMDFVGQYYPVLEPEIIKRKALHQQQQLQQQRQGFPRPTVPAQMLNGPVMGHFSQGPSTSPVSPSSHHPTHIPSQSLKGATSLIHQGHPHQPLSAPPLTGPSTPAPLARRMPPTQLGIVSPAVAVPPAFPSPTGSNDVSTASPLHKGKSQIEVNSIQRQDQDRKFQDLKQRTAIDWREKHQEQTLQQFQSETVALRVPQYPSQQCVPPVTQHHQHQQQHQLQQQHQPQPQRLQRQQHNLQHLRPQVQQRQLQGQPMVLQYQQQQIHHFINSSTSQDQNIWPTSSQQLPQLQHQQVWGIGPEQDLTSPRASNTGPALGNTVSPAEPVSNPMSNSATPSSTPKMATINPALRLSASPTSPAEPASFPTPVAAEDAGPIALESESTLTSTEPTGLTEYTKPTDPTKPSESMEPELPTKLTAPTAGSIVRTTASPSPSPSPELVAAPISDMSMTDAVTELTTTESSTTAALPEPPSHSTKMNFSGIISQSSSEQPTRPTQGLTGNKKRSFESAILLEETEDEDEHVNPDAEKGLDDDEGFSQPTPVDLNFDHDLASPLPPPPHKRLLTSADEFKHEPGKWYMSSVQIPPFSPSRSSPVVDTVPPQRRRIVVETDDDSEGNEDALVGVDDSFESTSY
ncbi:hypothetical protein BGZ91_007515 [Linnemannia elongata]|nr:hypothetical protein BGZ91_007515 [Linnemannia elongata]